MPRSPPTAGGICVSPGRKPWVESGAKRLPLCRRPARKPKAESAQKRMIPIHDHKSGATFALRVHPRARKNAITGTLGDALKVSLTAPPTESRANRAVIEFLAEVLRLPRSSVTIAAGHTSRNKVVRVSGLSASIVAERVATALP